MDNEIIAGVDQVDDFGSCQDDSSSVNIPEYRVILSSPDGAQSYRVQEVTESDTVDYTDQLQAIAENQVQSLAVTTGLFGLLAGVLVGLEVLRIWITS